MRECNTPAEKEEVMLRIALGGYIKYLRSVQRPREWTQPYLAKRASISQGLLSNVEGGKSTRMYTYICISHAFHLTYAELLRRALKYTLRKEKQ